MASSQNPPDPVTPSVAPSGPAAPADRLAGRGQLRRIERMALAWAALGAAVVLALGAPAQAAALTAVAVVSIVAFRGLQRIVSALGPADNPSRTIGWRPGLMALVRFALLGVFLLAAASFGPQLLPGLIAGASAVPAALVTEGALQAYRAFQRKDHDGS